MTEQHMLTTVDNPFNPFTQFDEWYGYDFRQGYNTPSFLARIVRTADGLSEADQDAAIDEIVTENVLGLYKKVSEPSTIPSSSVSGLTS